MSSARKLKPKPVKPPQAEVGWICPVCGAGNSPYSMHCRCMPGTPNVRIGTETGADPNAWPTLKVS